MSAHIKPAGDSEQFNDNSTFTPFGSAEPASPNLTVPLYEGRADALTLGPVAVVAGMVDTMGESLGITDEGDTEKFLKDFWPTLGTYYTNHKVPAQTIGDLTGMLIPGIGALKLYQGAGRIARMINGGRKSKLLDTIFTRSGRYQQELAAVKMRDQFLTSTGKFAGGNRRNLNPAGEAYRQLFARRAMTTRVSNVVKENLAFEAGVGVFFNSSDFLYPDEFGILGNAAIIAGLPATIAGGSALAVKRQLRASVQAVQVENVAGLVLDEIVNRVGNRGLGITLTALARAEVRKIYDDAVAKAANTTIGGKSVSFESIQSTANAEALVFEEEIKSQVKNLFKDKFIKELTKSEADDAVGVISGTKTVMSALGKDETVLLGAVSLESIATTRESLEAVITRKDKAVAKTLKELNAKDVEVQALRTKGLATGGSEELDLAIDELGKLRKKLDDLEEVEIFVLETDGSLIDAKMRKPIYQDGKIDIKTERETKLSPAIYRVQARSDTLFQPKQQVVGVTEDLIVLLPSTEGKTKISNINVTKVLKPHEWHDAKHFRQLLLDMGEDWHYKDGHRGREIFATLPKELQREIHSWTGSSASAQIRKWIADGDPRAQELINAYAPVRARLAEIADADGTIALYRGEGRGAGVTRAPKSDVVSTSASPEEAAKFGQQLIRKRVHIDDVIMIVGGMRGEKAFEYIIKGNKTRVNIGEVISPGNWEALTLGERSAVYAALQFAVEKYKPGKLKITVAAGDHHTRLDALLELDKKTQGKIWQDVQLPPGLNNIDDVEFASLSAKYTEYVRIREMQEASYKGQLNLSFKQKFNSEDIRKMLNLPGTGIGGKIHSLQEMFEVFFQQNNKILSDGVKNLEHLKRAVQENAFMPRMTSFKPAGVKMRGEMMNMPKDLKPVVVMKKPVHDEHYSRKYIAEAIAYERMDVLNKMATSGQSGAGLVQLVSDVFNGLEDAVRSASNVESLVHGQQRGTGRILTKPFAAGEMPAMVAATNLNLAVTKKFRKAIDAEFSKFHEVFNKIKSPANKGDMINYNLYTHARRQGWEIEEGVIEDGLVFFPMKDTPRNQTRWNRIYGTDMPEDAMMPAGGTLQQGKFIAYQPLGVTPLAMETGLAIADLGSTLLRNNNRLKSMIGKPELRHRENWVPPINFGDGNVAFVLDATGEVVSVTHGRNVRNAFQIAEAEAKTRGKGTFAVSRTNVGRYKDLEDEAFEKMMDYSDPINQDAGITGKQVGKFVDVGEQGLTDQIKGLQRQFDSTLNRSIATYFEPQIQYAKQRRNIAGIPEAETGKDIWSTYIQRLMGDTKLNPYDTVGSSYLKLERTYDSMLNFMFDKHANFFRPAGIARVRASGRDNKFYQALEGRMGDHNPFDSALEFANNTHRLEKPIFLTSAKDHAIRLNKLTSLLTLRLFETGHSVLTLTSLAATIPGVVAAMKKTDIEMGLGALTKEQGNAQYMARIGAFGIDVGDVAMFSPTRALMTGINDMFSEEGRKLWKRAFDKGYMDQAVSEMGRTLTAPAEGYLEGMYNNSTKMASWLSDHAEVWARGISFMTGHSIGKRALGLKNEDALFAFSHNFANQVIGDYAPAARPDMFRGAAGMPIGLFMTFMQNYYQRIFGYIENGQTRAAVTQFATQASVFGAQTVPGFNQFADTFFTSWDQTVNPVDSLNARFGHDNAEWFMNGILSNLPKMFGQDDGVSLYTRGDTNIKVFPSIFTVGDLPVASMMSNFYNGVRKTIGMLRQRGGVDGQQLSEIVQSYSTNRFLRNMASLYSGNITDKRGQVISSDTPGFGDLIQGDVVNGMALTARLLGMRTLNESNRVETHARVASTDLSRRYRMGELRDAVRAEFRKSKPDPEFLIRAVSTYVKQGGSPDYIPNWLMQQLMTSRVDKTSLRLMEVISNPNKSDEIFRLLGALTERPPGRTELE